MKRITSYDVPLPPRDVLLTDYMTPEQLESEYGIRKKQQNKLRCDKVRQQYLARGEEPIPYTRFGSAVRYNRAKINAWLESREVKTELKPTTDDKENAKEEVKDEKQK